MAIVRTISVSVSAKIGKLQKRMAKAAQAVGGFAASAAKATAGLSLAAAGAGAGLAFSAGKIIQGTNEMDDAAKSAGLFQKQLAGVGLFAGKAGVDVDEMTDQTRTLAEKAFEAVIGRSEDARESFEDLGISMSQLAKLGDDPIKLLELVSDRVADMETGIKKAAVASVLFGDGGAKVFNALGQGSKALQQAQEDAKLFGLGLEDDVIKRLKSTRDVLGTFKNFIVGLGRQLVGRFSFDIEKTSKKLVRLARGFIHARGGVEGIARRMAKWVKDIKASIGPAIERLGNVFLDFFKFLTASTGGFEGLIRIQKTFVNALSSVIDIVTMITANILLWIATMIEAGGGMQNIAQSAIAIGKAIASLIKIGVSFLPLFVEAMIKGIAVAIQEFSAFASKIGEFIDEAGGLIQMAKDIAEAWRPVIKLLGLATDASPLGLLTKGASSIAGALTPGQAGSSGFGLQDDRADRIAAFNQRREASLKALRTEPNVAENRMVELLSGIERKLPIAAVAG